MRKKLMTTYLCIFVFLLIIMSLSRSTSEKMRGQSIALLNPFWEAIRKISPFPAPSSSLEHDLQHLQVENQLLMNELAYLHAIQNADLDLQTQKRIQTIPAQVIFRSSDTWNQSLWINVGEKNNEEYSTPIVARYSPVVLGRAIVGIIDYVGQQQSRVRLITDPTVRPSVRAVRGGEQDLLMQDYVESLMQQLKRRKQTSLSPNDQESLMQLLKQFKQGINPAKKSWYLAKGELLGSSSLSRQGSDITLKGTGFNYDFADEEGEGRDLRTGKPFQQPQEPALSLLKVNDVLVTTGMDGFFPPGFQVATVTKIELLKEGDYFYRLEAQPVVQAFEELSAVFVLPPYSASPFLFDLKR